jgi:flavin reductase (DIM6/NTAB) family NADH-FMN oxidoreductase RutF
MRGVVRRILNTSIPQWALVSLETPQDIVSVTLHMGGDMIDVTHDHVIVCLRPLIVAVNLPNALRPAGAGNGTLRLDFRERSTDTPLGRLSLRPRPDAPVAGPAIHLFDVTAVSNRCLPAHRLWPHQAWMWWQMIRNPATLRVGPLDLWGLQVAYACPRPVGLVTLPLGADQNCFPFDLMARLGRDRFAFGLRVDRESSAQVSRARRLAVSLVPASLASQARALGRQHKAARVEWDSVPFSRRASPRWALPVPAEATEVLEVEVTSEIVLGSHALFTGTVVNQEAGTPAPGMFTVSGLFAEFRRLRGRGLTALS